ncbi:MAG: SMC-Scp complex subunit ScpB [Thermodesulfobacteriota bacterium]|nr:SMC-Scp complex subunit ScpB [Thermodesulfobacteriota bacterium]
MSDIKREIEALIFISDTPISIKELSSFLDISKNECIKIVNELQNDWKEMNIAIELENVSEGYQFRTKEEFKDKLTLFMNKKPFKLSRAALEVLGIVAKKQPVTKIEIDKIRGVDSSGVVSVLIDRELIKIIGEKEAPGRPYLYSTTNTFLEVFGLMNINELPDLEEFNDYDSMQTEDDKST